jgi:hypothetical protein
MWGIVLFYYQFGLIFLCARHFDLFSRKSFLSIELHTDSDGSKGIILWIN